MNILVKIYLGAAAFYLGAVFITFDPLMVVVEAGYMLVAYLVVNLWGWE